MKTKTTTLVIMFLSLVISSSVFAEGYLVTSDLWIKAVINTVEKGPIDAVFYNGGEKTTSRGDKVIWGYFYASPDDVSWGDQGNPDLYVKIWFDVSGRVDVNYFHVSVPDIEVYSDYPYDGTWDQHGTTTMDYRYIRHEYWRENPEPKTCENIDGKWSDYVTGNITVTLEGEETSSTISGYRTVSVEQTNCNVEWNYSDSGGYYTRTGNVEGNIVNLTGECADTEWLSSRVEDELEDQGMYGVNISFTTNTASGKGTISGNTISYKGDSCYLSGNLTYLGRSFYLSVSMSETSTLTKTSGAIKQMSEVERMDVLSPAHLIAEDIVKSLDLEFDY